MEMFLKCPGGEVSLSPGAVPRSPQRTVQNGAFVEKGEVLGLS